MPCPSYSGSPVETLLEDIRPRGARESWEAGGKGALCHVLSSLPSGATSSLVTRQAQSSSYPKTGIVIRVP